MTNQTTGQRTPGKWNVDVSTDEFNFINYTINGAGNEQTKHANARLIAAAPTMYDYIYIQARRGDMQAQKIIDELTATKET